MVEECMVCHEPTGKAGRDDDSLYTPNGVGPWCERCWDDAWPVMVPDAPDPALLALAKLGAWLCAHHWLDIDGGADGFGPAKSGLIMNAAMRYGVMHPDNSPRSGIAWTVESLLAPDGAASEGVPG